MSRDLDSLDYMSETAQEIKTNPDGSVTFVWDEPLGGTSSTTLSKKDIDFRKANGEKADW